MPNYNSIFQFSFGVKCAFFGVVLTMLSCKADPIKEKVDDAVQPETVIADTVFGELSEKQQYYQHLILEVPPFFQQNVDSLADWVVKNEPGGLKFIDWEVDSISRMKMKLDTLPIIQPLYYTNYFDYLSLKPYPYWDAAEENRNLKWAKIFSNDHISLIDFQDNFNQSTEFDEWIAEWKAETGTGFICDKFYDKNAKRDVEKFINALRYSANLMHVELVHFDTVALEPYRKSNKYKGLFLVTTNPESINDQLNGGADYIYIKMSDGGLGKIPFDDWRISDTERLAYNESTRRILARKAGLILPELRAGIAEQKKSVELNLNFRSTSLLANKSNLLPIKAGAKVFCPDKIKMKTALKAENKFKIYRQAIEGESEKIADNEGTKIIIIEDSLSAEECAKINGLTPEQDVIVCFSNQSLYPQLNQTPNLVFFNRNSQEESDHSILLQQLTGQLAFKGDFVQPDSVIEGNKTTKLRLARTQPEFCGLSADTLRKIDYAVSGALGGRAFPGCQVLIAKEGCIIYDKSFGYHSYDRVKPVTSESLYDLASLTKVVSTTMVGMKLYEMAAYDLLDSLNGYLPDSLKDHLRYPSTIRNLTFQEIFIHKSGMPAGFPIIKYMQYTNDEVGRFDKYFCDIADSVYSTEVAQNFFLDIEYQDSMWLRLNQIWLDPNKPYKYSDVNMNTLYFIFKSMIQNNPQKYGYRLRDDELKTRDLFVEFLYDKYYEALGMNRTKYKPLKHFNKSSIVPTENERFWRKQLLHGHVHDPNAALYGGVAGNAGIFSTTNDLAILGEMLQQKGTYNGTRYLKAETVNKFTGAQPNSHRGLGWNKPSLNTSAFGCAYSAPLETYGHTGFTGTCIWIDPVNKLTYIFLSNRVHPTVNNRIYQFGIRRRVHQAAYDAELFN